MSTFTIRETGIPPLPILVTWGDYALDFSCHQTLDEALDFIRQNPDIQTLRPAKIEEK